MAKTLRRYRGVDLEARRKAYGEIYVWLYQHHDGLLRDIQAMTPAVWFMAARKMEVAGVLSSRGEAPSPNAARIAWLQVARHHPEDAERHAAEKLADTRNPPPRRKGWVPTSVDPPARPVAQTVVPSTRAPAPPPPLTPPPATPAITDVGDSETLPLGHPDHPLGPLTNLEIAKLGEYPGASVEVHRRVLTTFRQMRHMDRFSRPGWR